jgi:hypothetical protein
VSVRNGFHHRANERDESCFFEPKFQCCDRPWKDPYAEAHEKVVMRSMFDVQQIVPEFCGDRRFFEVQFF